MASIYIIGDSTVDTNTPPFRGWGWAIGEFVRPGVTVSNHALSGTSTKSFWDQGLFKPIEESIKDGDLLLIQFGHNDEKEDEARHTDPFTTYTENLRRYCCIARSKGAECALITSVSRRFFLPDGSMLYTHGEYPLAVRKLAAEDNVPLCDLKLLSRQLYIKLGSELAEKLFVNLEPGEHPDFPDGHHDKTHFNAVGAAVMAKIVADELKKYDKCRGFFL